MGYGLDGWVDGWVAWCCCVVVVYTVLVCVSLCACMCLFCVSDGECHKRCLVVCMLLSYKVKSLTVLARMR